MATGRSALFPEPESPARTLARLGSVLRAARVRAQLSQADVATLIGGSVSTISELEAGERQPRHATLARLLRAIGGLTAGELMLQPWPAPAPVHSPAAWNLLREVTGFEVEHVVVTARQRDGRGETSFEARSVRLTDNRPFDRPLLDWIIGGLLQGPRVHPEDLEVADDDLAAGTKLLREGDRFHAWTFGDEWATSGFDYRSDSAEPAAEAILSLEVPAEMLTLRCSAPPEGGQWRPRLRIWPSAIPETEPDIARDLFPRGLKMTREGDLATVEIGRPLPGLRYQLGWEPGVDDGDSGPHSLAEVLHRARKRSGLGARALAERVGLSHGTVLNAEASPSNPTYRTLLGYSRMMPELRPQELFPVSRLDASVTPEDAWLYYRDLFGFEAEELVKTIHIDEQGRSSVCIETHGLRSIRGDLGDLRVRVGLQRAVSGSNQPALIESRGDDGPCERLCFEEGPEQHEFYFGAARVGMGLSHRRQYEGGDPYALVTDTTPDDDPLVEGAILALHFPVRSVRLEIQWPPGFEPLDASCHAWPEALPATEEPLTLSPHLIPPVHVFGQASSGRTLSMRVELPLPQVKYAMSWVVPERD